MYCFSLNLIKIQNMGWVGRRSVFCKDWGERQNRSGIGSRSHPVQILTTPSILSMTEGWFHTAFLFTISGLIQFGTWVLLTQALVGYGNFAVATTRGRGLQKHQLCWLHPKRKEALMEGEGACGVDCSCNWWIVSAFAVLIFKSEKIFEMCFIGNANRVPYLWKVYKRDWPFYILIYLGRGKNRICWILAFSSVLRGKSQAKMATTKTGSYESLVCLNNTHMQKTKSCFWKCIVFKYLPNTWMGLSLQIVCQTCLWYRRLVVQFWVECFLHNLRNVLIPLLILAGPHSLFATCLNRHGFLSPIWKAHIYI